MCTPSLLFFLNKLLFHKILYYKLCGSQKELKNINATDITVAFEKLSFYLIVEFGIRLVNCSEAKQGFLEREAVVFSVLGKSQNWTGTNKLECDVNNQYHCK